MADDDEGFALRQVATSPRTTARSTLPAAKGGSGLKRCALSDELVKPDGAFVETNSPAMADIAFFFWQPHRRSN